HAFDINYRPDDHFRIVGMYATTDIKGVNESNFSARFQTDYNSDTFSGQVKLQKKTNYFEQGMIGFPEPNNVTEGYFWLQRKWRFEGGDLRTINMNYNLNHNGTYDNSIHRNNMNINSNFNFQSEQFGYYGIGGGIWMSRGRFRQYNDPDQEDYVEYTAADTRHFDNYGYFKPFTDDTEGWWLWAETDFSNMFAGAINYNYDNFKTSRATSLYLTFQYRPTADLKVRLQYNYTDLAQSRFYDKAFLPSANIRTEYSILPNLFVKWFTQYNGQSRQFSNNVIFTYEYIRGSFIYFAYNEYGNIVRDEDRVHDGSLIRNYDLGRRTFSIKWTYSYFL
ncbi:MAG: hypothetical protein KDD94_13535, partial [Calditrichaeota bacterium]|nr:hypothetical protein [Calditrichota bacterium]